MELSDDSHFVSGSISLSDWSLLLVDAVCVALMDSGIQVFSELGSSGEYPGQKVWIPFLVAVGVVLGCVKDWRKLSGPSYGQKLQLQWVVPMLFLGIGVLAGLYTLSIIGFPGHDGLGAGLVISFDAGVQPLAYYLIIAVTLRLSISLKSLLPVFLLSLGIVIIGLSLVRWMDEFEVFDLIYVGLAIVSGIASALSFRIMVVLRQNHGAHRSYALIWRYGSVALFYLGLGLIYSSWDEFFALPVYLVISVVLLSVFCVHGAIEAVTRVRSPFAQALATAWPILLTLLFELLAWQLGWITSRVPVGSVPLWIGFAAVVLGTCWVSRMNDVAEARA